MHRSSFSIGASSDLAHHLGNDLVHGEASHVGPAMDSVGTDECVLASEGVVVADGDGLLTVVEMEETSDHGLFVKLVTSDFHSSDGDHVGEHGLSLLGGQFGLGWDGLWVDEMAVHGWL